MRFASPPILRSAVIYGLLAVAHGLPTGSGLDDERRSLDRRSLDERAPMPPPVIKPVVKPGVKPPPGTHPDAPGTGGPDAPAPLRPGGVDPVAPGAADDVHLGVTKPKDPATAGKKNIDALDAKLKENPIKSKDFSDYDAKIEKYSVDVYDVEPSQAIKTDKAAKWYMDNGVPVGTASKPGPNLKGVDIYGKKGVNLDDPDIDAAWTAQIDPKNGVMTRQGEFRTGKAGNMDSEAYYHDIPEKDRIYISTFIAKQWKENGGGLPMNKNAVTGIVSDDMKGFVQSIIARGGNPSKVTPADPEWNAIMGGSAGSPLARAMTDHPDVFHNYRPKEVSLYQNVDGDNKGMVDAIFTLGP